MKQASSPAISRRNLLAGAGGLAVAMAAPRTADALSRRYLVSESGRLRRVLLNPATTEDFTDCAVPGGADSLWQDAVADIVAQQAGLALQLESSGVKVMRLEDVLQSAIRTARQQGTWMRWLKSVYPELRGSASVGATTLLARGTKACAANAARESQPMHGLSYMRDFAVMIPGGLVLANVAADDRSRQQALFRFMVEFAPELSAYPVVFDARSAGLRAEGGDIQVLDERTLLVGVGNHTDPRVAAPLARRTGRDVITVNIGNAVAAKWRLDHDPLRDFFLHLNTSVAQVAPGHVLALPWLFEARYTGSAALKHPDPLVAGFGTVARYHAWSGDRDTTVTGVKLVDYLREGGTRLSFIGGTEHDELEPWLNEIARTRVIFPKRERQGANLLATSASSLLAFHGAERTHAALRADGVQVHMVAGQELWRGYGGPNCLTLPLERA
jgi:arginine deiminase